MYPPPEVYSVTADGITATAVEYYTNASAQIRESPDGSKVIYASERNSQKDIYIANTDGSNEFRLTDNNLNEWYYAWSPSGEKIAYIACNQDWDSCQAGIVGVDGQNEVIIVKNQIIDDLVWSPDGSELLLTIYSDDSWSERDLYRVSVSSHTVSPLTSEGSAGYGAWSPEGAEVYYSSSIDGDAEIYVIGVEGGSATQLTSNTYNDFFSDLSPDGSVLLYYSYIDGDYELFSMNSDGTSQLQLTNNTSYDGAASFSPSGDRIAFMTNRDGIYEFYAMNVDGTGLARLTNNATSKSYFSWKSDSSGAYYLLLPPSSTKLYTSKSDGSDVAQLSEDGYAYNDWRGRWSPDGTKIAFSSNRDGNNEVYIMNSDGTNQVNITNNPGSDVVEDWSPDGTQLLVSSNRLGSGRLWAIDIDGSSSVCITCDLPFGGHYNPSWSPKGDRIAVQSNGDGRGIFLINPDGSNFTQLTTQVGSTWIDKSPTWSPDGSMIAFYSTKNGPNQEYIMNSDGSSIRQLTYTDGFDASPFFSPDGSKIAFYRSYSDSYGVHTIEPDGTDLMPLMGYSTNWGSFYGWQPIPNTSPVTVSDTLSIPYQIPSLVDVLANDTDEEALDGTNLSVTVQPSNGTASAVDGKVRYIPNTGFQGSDSLAYQICDSFTLDQKCATGTLNITVQAPTAPALGVGIVGGVSFVESTGSYLTSSLRPTFSGTATPGAEIRVEIHSDPIVLTTTASGDGNWSVTPTFDLPSGEHMVYISATLNGLTTELGSFGLTVGSLANTGVSLWFITAPSIGLLFFGSYLLTTQLPKRQSSKLF